MKVVFSPHAKQRAGEIGRSEVFLQEKLLNGRRKKGGKGGRYLITNGHYEFVCKDIKESPDYEWQDVLLVVTVINGALRKFNE